MTTAKPASLACHLLTKFSVLSNFQYILVEFVIVCDGEDHLVEALQLFDVVHSDVPELCAAPVSHTQTRAFS